MIQMNAFQKEPEGLISGQIEAAARVIRSGWYVLGPEVAKFESAWARRCGVEHAVGVGNGMDAIELGLRALAIGPGDEVITTGMTAFATVLAILRAGARPVLADIDPTSGLLATASVERCISKKTKALLLVHLYGQVRGMEAWAYLCEKNRILLLEDCAQAHDAKSAGKVAGSFGAWGAYSFYPTKNLGAIGDGGALISSQSRIAEQVQRLRNYGQSERYSHPQLGMNSRLDEIQAAILAARLEYLDDFTKQRRHIAQSYDSGLKNAQIALLAPPLAPENHVHHLYVVLTSERDKLQKHLRERGVESLIHYPRPVHLQEPCASIARDPAGLKCTEDYAKRCLSLPCHPQMGDKDISQVIEAVNSFQKNY